MTPSSVYASAIVWDQTFPVSPTCGTFAQHVGLLERMAASGFTVASLTVANDPEEPMVIVRRIAEWRRYLLANPDKYRLLLTAEDAEIAKAEGKVAVGFHFQGTTPFERDLALVEMFYTLGVRHALMAYNQKNHVADGCHERTDAGLSRFGVDLVREMQRVGMVVDVTHTGTRSALDVFEIAEKPVIYSHSNPRAICDHERNITDEMALACKATGGVVGVNGIGTFLGDMEAPTELFFRHVDHWVQLLGADHVGIGIDTVSHVPTLAAFINAEAAKYPAGQNYQNTHLMKVFAPEQMPEFAELMAKAGYTEGDMTAVLGGNWLRVARELWTPRA